MDYRFELGDCETIIALNKPLLSDLQLRLKISPLLTELLEDFF